MNQITIKLKIITINVLSDKALHHFTSLGYFAKVSDSVKWMFIKPLIKSLKSNEININYTTSVIFQVVTAKSSREIINHRHRTWLWRWKMIHLIQRKLTVPWLCAKFFESSCGKQECVWDVSSGDPKKFPFTVEHARWEKKHEIYQDSNIF